MQEITGLSTGSATYALRALTDLGLMDAAARRGRNSARQIPDPNRLLDAYAAAAAAMLPQAALTVGVTWRDPATALTHTGQRWDSAGISWAATAPWRRRSSLPTSPQSQPAKSMSTGKRSPGSNR